MLDWLRRRIWREHVKLVHQNVIACGLLSDGSFADQPALAIALRADRKYCKQFYASLRQRLLLKRKAASEMLQLNKDLRRLYDTAASRHIESFDVAMTPLLGWREFIASFADDAE